MDNKNNTLPSKDLIVNVLLGIIILLAFWLPEEKRYPTHFFIEKCWVVSIAIVGVLQHKEKITLRLSQIVISITTIIFLISLVYFVFLQK